MANTYCKQAVGETFRDKPKCGEIVSNFDGIVDKKVEAELIKANGTAYASFPGWDFYGAVIYKDKQFQCEVWQAKSVQEVIKADTVEEMRTLVCGKYGWD
jgi:hypothetical protein